MIWLRLSVVLAVATSATTPLPADAIQEQSGPEMTANAPAAERTGPTDPAELAAFVDGVMKIQLDEHNTAGAVVTVVRHGEVLFSRGYGYADWKARAPVDPARTLFRIGSISKLFVWTSVMQLVEQGVLDLDTDINEYLDGVVIPEAFDRPVTLGDILSHSAGFEDWVVGLFGEDESSLRPLQEILAEQTPARVRPPGEVSSYSNHATGMAALIVEQVTGTPWDRFNQEHILDPLGMEQFSFAQPLPDDLAGDMSKGYSGSRPNFRERDFEYVPLYPVGAAAASGAAMARFMVAHLHDGALGDARILEEETARAMHSDLFKMGEGVNAAAHGFYEMSRNGERIIGHGGDTRWFHSQLALFPDRDLGVFVSYNSSGGGAASGEFIAAFVDRYFPGDDAVPTPPEDADYERFTGWYRGNRFSHSTVAKFAALGGETVEATDDRTLRALDSEWVEVAPLTFKERYGDRTLVFRENADGDVTHFFLARVPVVAFERIPWRENPILNGVLLAFACIMIGGAVLAWPLGWLARRWYGVKREDLVMLPPRARLALRLTALLFVVYAAAFALSGPDLIFLRVGAVMKAVLLLPWLGVAMTLVCVYCAVVIQQQRFGRRLSRIAYSTTVLAFVVLLWQINVWNLMGWRF